MHLTSRARSGWVCGMAKEPIELSYSSPTSEQAEHRQRMDAVEAYNEATFGPWASWRWMVAEMAILTAVAVWVWSIWPGRTGRTISGVMYFGWIAGRWWLAGGWAPSWDWLHRAWWRR